MARGSKVRINRNAARQIPLAIADGLFEVARTVIEVAQAPDAPPYGVGLVQGGGAIAYVDGKKVNDSKIGGRAIAKPRAIRVAKSGVTVIGGWGFPARFVEFGTIHAAPHPFLTPAFAGVTPAGRSIAAPVIRDGLARIR